MLENPYGLNLFGALERVPKLLIRSVVCQVTLVLMLRTSPVRVCRVPLLGVVIALCLVRCTPGESSPHAKNVGGTPSPRKDPPPVDGGDVPEECETTQKETLPDPTKSVDDLVAAYTPAESDAFVAEVTKRRYPLGHRLLTHLRSDKTHCYDRFFTDRSSADRALALLSVLVHECGHSLDLSLSSPGSNHYVIAGDLELTCTFGDTTERRGLTFARSQILNDEFQALRPPCPPGEKEECDTYANLYLGGSSGDDVLQGGDQGFNMLIEEWVQYIHALATDYAIAELLTRDGVSISSRDGVLTFMWYVERYLRMARLEYPEAYRYLAGGDGGCWRDVILALWDRSEVYLAATKDLQGLGIRDAAIAALVENDEMKGEIDRIRAAGTCP